MILLDTNVLSGLRQRRRQGSAFNRWAEQVDPAATSLSAITLWEIEEGVLRMERRDQRQGAALRRWFDEVLGHLRADQILPVDAAVARICAQLHVPDPRPYRDSLIAATAIAHGLTVATRNTADFAPMGVPVLNPWELA